MQSYISSVLQQLLSREKDISKYTIILPSKRAGSSLKKELSTMLLQPKFSPQIYSIEDFVTVVSDLSPLVNVEVLFQFYSVYKELTPVEKLEDFETFSNWAQTLIHDFNEIDRYLIDSESFFNYLAEIQDINHWYLQERTELIENYLSFWNQLPTYFLALRNQMLKSKKAYQGYIFRKASENIKSYINNVTNPHIFIGFNALNSAEQIIFQEFLDSKKGEVFWDVEKSFYEDSFHEAGYFFRDYF
ncbi:MAG TPA: PD-(D/E)XK nuclease family protein, partial [Salinimicrobium sp.]|nr:PD-(D/E)XK nuclease family protein [Salinimicrobium sp.]